MPRGFWLKKILPCTTQDVHVLAFLEFAHILWEATKPTIVLTDNKSVTRFFETMAIPSALWNACNYVLQFNFKIAGSVNTAADVLSRIELKANARIRVEQDVNRALKNMKLKILGQPYDEVLIMTDSRFKNNKEN